MKTLLRTAALVASLVAGTGCGTTNAATGKDDGANPLVARAHFVGSAQLFAEPGSAKLKEIWTQPGSIAFRNQVVDRFSKVPAVLFGIHPTAEAASTLRPLIEDLLTYESYSEITVAPEFAVAIRLPDNRAKSWDATLRQAVTTWKLGAPAALSADGLTGWEAKRRQAPQVLRFGRIGEWTIVASGPEKLSIAPALIGKITSGGRPAKTSGAWLDGDANLARLGKWLPMLTNFKNLPVAHYSLSNRADYVRTLMKLEYPKAHDWKAEPWRIPTNSIFDPLISFNAGRGIAPVLDSIPEVREIGWSPTPSQFCGWGLRKLPFQFFYTTPTRDVTNQLKKVAPRLHASIFSKEHPNLTGRIAVNTNAAEVYWQGLPLAVPRLAPLRNDPSFLAFEMFPLAPTRTRPPSELFQQLSRDNLVYYDWEITEDRIPNWRQFYQIAEIATQRQLSPSNSVANRFILDISPKLGECVTEVTATSPTEMTVIRKSHMGLNSFEVVALSRWMESTNFPAFGIFPPQPPKRSPARGGVLPPPATK